MHEAGDKNKMNEKHASRRVNGVRDACKQWQTWRPLQTRERGIDVEGRGGGGVLACKIVCGGGQRTRRARQRQQQQQHDCLRAKSPPARKCSFVCRWVMDSTPAARYYALCWISSSYVPDATVTSTPAAVPAAPSTPTPP